jgi:signal transduction histidine kinase
MKALGLGAKDLPWLSPSAQSLRALARSPLATVWPQLRTDPGIVLLLARAWGRRPRSLNHRSCDIRVLRMALRYLRSAGDRGCVDWTQPVCRTVYETSLDHARLAESLAGMVPGCDPVQAWVAGFTASLGWITACTIDPARVEQVLTRTSHRNNREPFDSAGVARRASHVWALPAWLSALGGHLGLPVEFATSLGAEPLLFQVVQLAVLLRQRDGDGLGLAVGADLHELLGALRLTVEQIEPLTDRSPSAEVVWEPPSSQPLLVELLDLALENRQRAEAARCEELHCDIDRLEAALAGQRAQEARRLQSLKLSALAEFAAGAGHEINNPLAVISGQAQYLLRQLDMLDGPAEEIDNPLEYLANLRSEITPSLQKVIHQTHRIHGILTELMQFARPAQPKLQALDVSSVISDVVAGLETVAHERHVQLVSPPAPPGPIVRGDPGHVRVAIHALLRNAIEAAPAGGWAGVRVEQDLPEQAAIIVEDSGPGPGPVAQAHLFDPFFSGRSAGRGRGLGLPTAWRLACQQDGDLRFDGTSDGVTRFSLLLPIAAVATEEAYANGCHGNGQHA